MALLESLPHTEILSLILDLADTGKKWRRTGFFPVVTFITAQKNVLALAEKRL